MSDSERRSIDHQRLLREVLADTPGTQTGDDRPAPPSPTELAPHFPDFEILALVGRGGMGAVYKAVQKRLGRTVALKVMPKELGAQPEFRERFEREARVLATLNHPHVIAVHDFGAADGWCYLVTEFVDGVDLRRLMALGHLSPTEALRIAPQICQGLQYAHERGVVHRDVKPENILIDANGQVKVADFGLAKVVTGAVSPVALTRSTAVLGTPHYMAPEQWRGSGAVDHRADIYALGVVLYEMLTGELPLGAYEPPSRRDGVPPGLDEVVRRALAQRPENRYQQAREVERDVEQRRATPAAATAAQAAATAVPSDRTTRGPFPWGTLLAVLALSVVGFGVLVLPATLDWSLAGQSYRDALIEHYEATMRAAAEAAKQGQALPEDWLTAEWPGDAPLPKRQVLWPLVAALLFGLMLLQMLVGFGALRRMRNRAAARGIVAPRGLVAAVVVAWLLPAAAFVALLMSPAAAIVDHDLQVVVGIALGAASGTFVAWFLRSEVRRQRRLLAEAQPVRAGVLTWLATVLMVASIGAGVWGVFGAGGDAPPVAVTRGPMPGRDLIGKPVEFLLQRLGAPKSIWGSGAGQQWTYTCAAPEQEDCNLSVHDGVVLAAPGDKVLLVGEPTDRTPYLGQRVTEVTKALGAPQSQVAGEFLEEWYYADGTTVYVHQARVVGVDRR
ncbi:MAG: protein kinase [Planctomycetota bacterium]